MNVQESYSGALEQGTRLITPFHFHLSRIVSGDKIGIRTHRIFIGSLDTEGAFYRADMSLIPLKRRFLE